MQALNQLLDNALGTSGLMDRLRQSQDCLVIVSPLLPESLKPHVQAGPIDAAQWCLLVRSPAVSTKLRQLVPSMLTKLRQSGWNVESIRIKVQSKV